jgi:hypothetical protein
MSDEPKDVPKPWERQADEPEEAYDAFRKYINQPPRGRRLHYGLAKDKAKLSGWCRQYCWHDRADAYDAVYEQIADEERARIYQRNAEVAAIDTMIMLGDAKDLVQRELAKYLEASRDNDMVGLMKPNEMTRLLETAVKLDRLVRGETTENIGKTDLDTSKLSIDELEQLSNLLAKAGKKD